MSVAPIRPTMRDGRTPGCTDACTVIVYTELERFGRRSTLLHDAYSHERYGADCAIAASDDRIVRSGPLAVNLGALMVSVSGHGVALTPTELRAILALARHIGGVVRFVDLLSLATDDDGREYSPNYIRTVVQRLRARLGMAGDRIVTHTGLGYRLLRDDEPQPPARLHAWRMKP